MARPPPSSRRPFPPTAAAAAASNPRSASRTFPLGQSAIVVALLLLLLLPPTARGFPPSPVAAAPSTMLRAPLAFLDAAAASRRASLLLRDRRSPGAQPLPYLLAARLRSSTRESDVRGPSTSSSPSPAPPPVPSNRDIVTARLEAQAARRAARARSLTEDRERNLRLKRLIHSSSSSARNATGTGGGGESGGSVSESGHPIPSLYAVRVSVCQDLRRELRMNGREKRGRVFVEFGSDGCRTLRGLKFELHAFFRALRKSTYVLSAGLPGVAEDGSIASPQDIESDPANATSRFWPVETDEDVKKVFEMADEFFTDPSRGGTRLKRPSLLLHVRKDPNAPPPPPPPEYLKEMPDPAETESMTMLSFYAFPPGGVADPEEFAAALRRAWKPFGALGRVYVAYEGVNAQMSVPTNVLDNFMACCRSIPELGVHMENGVNIDPIPLTIEEFKLAGDMDGKPVPPFKNLHIRVRNQVVADGLDKPLNWQIAGYDMPPLEWHEKLKEAREKRASGNADADTPLIFDCRNTYETDVGKFEGAEPLKTENFRDSWDVFKEQLANKPKDTPIMTYCTGGIRCVKVGAYLTQELGFTNVSRLAGGIIAYDRTLNEKVGGEDSLFKGTNYVFDGRVGRQITDDAMGECVTCGAKANLLSNCANNNCHKRMVQCSKCRTAFLGTCSDACKQRVLNSAMAPRRGATQADDEILVDGPKYSNLDDYSAGHTSPAPSLYHEIESNTASYLATGSHMVSGASQGRLLTQLTSMTREGRVLELGTFTGYATCCFLEGAANAGESTNYIGPIGTREGGPFVMSLERDGRAIDLAASHLKIMSRFGVGEEAAEEACKLRGENGNVEEVKEDVIYTTFKGIAGCEILRVTDALATVEAMARGNEATKPFDLVFVDADKTRLLDYVEACVSSDSLLKKGGLIVVDNVLWKGLVLDASRGGISQATIDEQEGLGEKELKKNRRARKLAALMHNFNSAVVKDDRLEVVMLPMRDGLSIIRKR